MSVRNGANALSRSALLVGASAGALIFATPALAQDPPPPTDDQEEAAQIPTDETTPADTATGGTIVVTGSRIRQQEFTSPDPVTTIDPATSQREGKNDTADMLQSSPIAAGSTQITSAISSNFVTNGGPGAQTIDLRGLGPNRTLVLLNGRRAGPAGTRGGVSSFDLNVLPQAIVQRVDILKTGASSIYGSDAIAGVVNLITKTDTDGFEIEANVSAPFRDGGEQFRVTGLWGKKFDRGHVMVAADYFKQRELARGDRSYLECPEAYVFDPDTGERADLVDPRTGQFKCEDLRWGHVWTYDLEYIFGIGPGTGNQVVGGMPLGPITGGVTLLQFQYPGEVLGIPPLDPGVGVIPFGSPPGWFPTGYSTPSLAVQNSMHPFVLEQSIIPKTERYTIYADGAFELTNSIELFGEFLANRRKTYQNSWRQFWAFGATEDLYGGTFWADGWEGLNWLSPTAITNHFDSSQKVDYWRGVGGVRGDFGGKGFFSDWSYDAFVQYSHNKGLYRQEHFLQEIYDVSYFQSASCVGTTLPISGKQCMDLPWLDPFFLRGEFSPELADYMFDWDEGKTIYTQLTGEASVSGSLFELPAGPVGIALGATARKDEIEDTPGDITLAGNGWGVTTGGITAGDTVTTEAFGELHIPILKDRPFFKDLAFSGAARITNVKATRKDDGLVDKDTGNWTYKLGGNWAVNDWLRFRGTYGTSFRAPALFEQFKANETGFISARNIDPCVQWAFNLAQGNIDQRTADNCAADGIPPNYAGGSITATVFSTGGIGALDPETSTAKTASIILTPTFAFLPETRLSLAVDWFDITVKDQVTQLGAANIVFGCYGSEFFPDDPLCGLFERGLGTIDPFAVVSVTDRYINIAKQQNEGIDVTGLVQHNLGRLGSINFLAQMTWQLKDTFALFEDTEVDDNGEIGQPKWVGDFNLTWRAPNNWTLFWGTDVIGKADNEDDFRDAHGGDLCITSAIRNNPCVDVSVPTTFYHAASVTKEFPRNKLEFTLGMANIFDTKPPRTSTIGGIGIPSQIGPVVATSQYEFIGRRVFFNISKKF